MSNERDIENKASSSFDWSANPQEHYDLNSEEDFKGSAELINLSELKKAYQPYDSPK